MGGALLPVKIEAIGYKQGREIAREVRETTGPRVALVVGSENGTPGQSRRCRNRARFLHRRAGVPRVGRLKAFRRLEGPNIALADVTTPWAELLKHKEYWEVSGNNVNHPNDFGHRLYAQVICRLYFQ